MTTTEQHCVYCGCLIRLDLDGVAYRRVDEFGELQGSICATQPIGMLFHAPSPTVPEEKKQTSAIPDALTVRLADAIQRFCHSESSRVTPVIGSMSVYTELCDAWNEYADKYLRTGRVRDAFGRDLSDELAAPAEPAKREEPENLARET